jgi:AcrR family transcriptional regulator
MDARQLKTRARLADAILTLAADRPVTEITVSEVAAAARVHRSTFYEHAASPGELLQSVLRRELDELRQANLVGITVAETPRAVTRVTEGVLRHIDSHAAIYARGLGEGSGSASLQAMLSAHFRESTDLLFDQGVVTLPPGPLDRDAVAAYIADGTVGAIEVWLRQPAPRDVGLFLAQFALLVPSWWPNA